MTSGTKGYEANVGRFIEASQSLDFAVVCKDYLTFLPEKSARILDVGSGVGQNAAALNELGYQVTAVDPMTAFVDYSRQTYGSTDIDWHIGSLPELSCLSGIAARFDFVLIEGVWHHLDENERYLSAKRISELSGYRSRCAISLRNGPAGLGSHVFPTSARLTCDIFGEFGFKCIYLVENQDSILPNKEKVKWSKIVLEKVL